jgi:CheY-like chemotaxis protein
MTDKEPELEKATPQLAAKDTFRVLILDDIEHVNQLKAACKNAGHSVVPAHTVKEAMSFLDGTNHADVIICAAYLEDENIFEFLKRLRKNPAHKATMFMILALAPGPLGVKMNAQVEIAGRHLGSDAFISMPVFDPVQLIAAIKTLLPIVPWLQRSNLEYEEKKNELEKIRQKLVQDIGEAENRGGKDASGTELVTSQAALESIEQLIEEGRKKNEADNN